MKTIFKILMDDKWYRQFVYGAILALFFGLLTILAGYSPVWVIAQVAIIAAVREHYLQDLGDQFNWRNFFFLLVPVVLLYMLYSSI